RSAGTVLDPRQWRARPAVVVAAGLLWATWALRRAARG
ncbi:MAG: hypothetical protein JWM62_1956, partial [Frankiales bacterium]|nr:hypothetical protein [Frankiales bacterium]